MVSTNGDIYSYGILVLETVTGKRPTDSGSRQGLTLREYVELGLDDRVIEIVDTQLSLGLENGIHIANDSPYRRKIDCLASLLRLGMSCSQELPSSRTPTGDIIKELHAMKESLESIQHVQDGKYP
jgi:serine/threonine protein kinase